MKKEIQPVIYPNPGDGFSFSIRMEMEEGVPLVKLIDFKGREIECTITEKEKNEFVVHPAGKLASGIYMVKTVTGNKVYSNKLIVN
jgi:hypothetical protein